MWKPGSSRAAGTLLMRLVAYPGTQEDDMLAFEEGDAVEILEYDEKTGDGYWLGRCNGKVLARDNLSAVFIWSLYRTYSHGQTAAPPAPMLVNVCVVTDSHHDLPTHAMAGGILPFGAGRSPRLKLMRRAGRECAHFSNSAVSDEVRSACSHRQAAAECVFFFPCSNIADNGTTLAAGWKQREGYSSRQ